MNNDYRQSEDFKNMLLNGGCKIFDFEEEEGYSIKAPIPFMNYLVVPRVNNLGILEKIENVPFKYRSLFINILPKIVTDSAESEKWIESLKKFGYKQAKFGMAPTKTIEIDISLNEEDILAQMLRQTRYNIGVAKRKGVTTEIISGDKILTDPKLLDPFYTVYSENCKRARIKGDTKQQILKYVKGFKENMIFIIAFAEGGIAAVASYIVSGNTITYNQNGSTDLGRKNNAAKLLVWEGIVEGKKRGCSWFDFDGIYDARFTKAQDKWKGFTRFKSGFGGFEREYLGSFIKWFPLKKIF